MKRDLKKNFKGISLIELILVIIIFSSFMLGVYTVMDAGMKAWNMGSNRTDIQNAAMILVKRMVREISVASSYSVTVDEAHGDYIAFETPVKNGTYAYNKNTGGTPWWQGYIMYYSYPLNSPDKIRKLYRIYDSHSVERGVPIPVYITFPDSMFAPSASYDENKLLLENVETFEITREGNIVNIKLVLIKEGKRQDTKAHSVAGTSQEERAEIFEVQAAVMPNN